MKNIKIGTWKIENSYFLTKENKNKVDAVLHLLYSEDLDVLGLQEVNPLLASKIGDKLKKINSDYVITSSGGKYKNPIKNLMVNDNIIISRLPYLGNQTIELPFFPTYVETYSDVFNIKDRSLTMQDLVLGNDIIRFYNTQLERRDEALNREQFDVIFSNLSSSVHADNILMGNLNIMPGSYNMDYYRTMLDGIDMKIVDNGYRTYKGDGEQVVDYIIVPNSYHVSDIMCIDSYDSKISKYNPLIVKVKK